MLLVYRAAVNLLDGQPLELVETDLNAALKIDHDQTVAGAITVLRSLIAAYQDRTQISLKLLRKALSSLPESAFAGRVRQKQV